MVWRFEVHGFGERERDDMHECRDTHEYYD